MANISNPFFTYLSSLPPLSSLQEKVWTRVCEEYSEKNEALRFFRDKVLPGEKSLSHFDRGLIRLDCDYLVFVDGFFEQKLSSYPDVLEVYEESEAEKIYSHFMQNHFGNRFRENLFPPYWLSYLLSRKKIWVVLPAKTVLKRPIQIIHISSQDNALIFSSVHILMGKESSASFFVTGTPRETSYVCPMVDFFLEEGAKACYRSITIGGVQEEVMVATVKKGASLEVGSWNSQSPFHRKYYQAFLEGEKSHFSLLGGWNISKREKMYMHCTVDHRGVGSCSKQLIKGIVQEKSFSSFLGSVYIRPSAYFSESSQLNHNLVLGEGRAHTSPQLRVFVDEVKASHGATIAQMDEEELFYLQTRGISKEESRKMFMEGFVKDITDGLGL